MMIVVQYSIEGKDLFGFQVVNYMQFAIKKNTQQIIWPNKPIWQKKIEYLLYHAHSLSVVLVFFTNVT